MARTHHLIVKSFIRQALRSSGAWVTDAQDAADALMALQLAEYTKSTESDTTVIATSQSGKTFQFMVTPGLSRADLMKHAEVALNIIEPLIVANDSRAVPLSDADLVTYIRRKVLTTANRSRPNFN